MLIRWMRNPHIRFRLVLTALVFGAFAGTTAHSSHWAVTPPAGAGAPPLQYLRTYVPPARKAIIVGLDGQAHRTADNTLMTLRDRSREELVPRYRRGNNADIVVAPNRQKDFVAGVIGSSKPARTPDAPKSLPAPTPAEIENAIQSSHAGDRYLTDFDRRLAHRIRNAFTADDALFITAMNVRIEVVNGRVTLTGPVNSAREKERFGHIAKKIAGRRQVANRLAAVV